MPLIWSFNGQAPGGIQGQIYTASLGTAVAFSVGPALAYTGLAIANPATKAGAVPVKIVPLRVVLSPVGTSGAPNIVPFGILKLTGQGTASNGGLSAFSGAMFSPGVLGTTTPIAQVGGTFSVINGTAAGTGSNTLYWHKMLGVVASGTGTQVPGLSQTVEELNNYTSAMPGETIAIGVNQAITAYASITWAEIPLNSGA